MSRLRKLGVPALVLLALVALAGCGEPIDEEEAGPDASQIEEAAPPPAADLWLASLSEGTDGLPSIGTPENLTRRAAYDNQPFFLPDGERILYTAGREDGGTDIHLFDLEARSSRVLMETSPESEYSPTPRPDGQVVVVRVEADGTTQRLWSFELEGGPEGDRAELLLPDLAPVGYHAWIDDDRVAAYVLGEPASLQLAEVGTDRNQIAFEGIGPSVQKIPGEAAVSFVELWDAGSTWIRRLDAATGSTSRIVEGIDGASDHAWTPGGILLMAAGAEIFAHRPGIDEGWESLGHVGPEGVVWSRMAVSPAGDRIVLVGVH